MLTEHTLAELRELIGTSAPAERRAELLGAIEDLQRAIAAQAITMRALTSELRNRRIGQEAMGAMVPPSVMDDLAARLGQPRQTPFSIAEATAACDALSDEAARGADLAAIATAIVRVVRVFV